MRPSSKFISIWTLCLAVIFISSEGHTQIFYNGDFEINDGCNTTLGQVTWVDGWFTVVESADFYSCGFTTDFFPTDGEAACGDAYMGFASYGDANGSAEAIGSQLPSPLVAGLEYEFSVQVKIPTGGFYSTPCGGLCVYGFVNAPPQGLIASHPSLIDGATELVCTETVDNQQWEEQVINFVADQAYNYLVFSVAYAPGCAQNIFLDCISIVEAETFQEQLTVCEGEELTLDPGFGAETDWNIVNDDQTLTFIQQSENYTFTATESINILAQGPEEDTFTYFIEVVNYPEVDLGDDFTACEGDEIVLESGSAESYVWNGEAGGQMLAVTESGVYTLEASNGECISTDEVEVTIIPMPVVDLGPDILDCEGNEVLVNANAEVVWDDGTVSSGYLVQESGTYTASITNECFVVEDEIEVGIVVVPPTALPTALLACVGDSLTLDLVIDVDAAVWFVNDTTYSGSEIVIGESAEVLVQYVYQGCDATDEVSVTFEPSLDMSKVVMPNIFTPNYDGVNDFIRPIYLPDLSLNLCAEDELITIDMNIFNRWGEQLVESACSWDARQDDGNTVASGSYYYIVDLYSNCLSSASEKRLTGVITITY
ncbi:gliding motility-associated C-terminal domain-containing protein [Sanyastnella coralliicola]|uniref:T9SS type B sorting domain-containing protein n=1 Tax=Sanyastnella coralliicola TaxID=3069118 RepID=UPI0027B90BB5|nr:gliding motility-associated C-terminal domain-containing protein [Longitalea sp. SCSIO 12813]